MGAILGAIVSAIVTQESHGELIRGPDSARILALLASKFLSERLCSLSMCVVYLLSRCLRYGV